MSIPFDGKSINAHANSGKRANFDSREKKPPKIQTIFLSQHIMNSLKGIYNMLLSTKVTKINPWVVIPEIMKANLELFKPEKLFNVFKSLKMYIIEMDKEFTFTGSEEHMKVWNKFCGFVDWVLADNAPEEEEISKEEKEMVNDEDDEETSIEKVLKHMGDIKSAFTITYDSEPYTCASDNYSHIMQNATVRFNKPKLHIVTQKPTPIFPHHN